MVWFAWQEFNLSAHAARLLFWEHKPGISAIYNKIMDGSKSGIGFFLMRTVLTIIREPDALIRQPAGRREGTPAIFDIRTPAISILYADLVCSDIIEKVFFD